MAVEPLYNVKATLISKLRMTDTSDTNTLAVIDQAIQDVRLEFYRRLGLGRAGDIASLSLVENPTTDNEVLRSTAAVTEVYWVMYKLVCILPVMYIETQFAIQHSFDDVPITRDADSLSKFKECLWNSIEQNIGIMMIPVDSNQGSFGSFSVGKEVPSILDNNFIGLPRA